MSYLDDALMKLGWSVDNGMSINLKTEEADAVRRKLAGQPQADLDVDEAVVGQALPKEDTTDA